MRRASGRSDGEDKENRPIPRPIPGRGRGRGALWEGGGYRGSRYQAQAARSPLNEGSKCARRNSGICGRRIQRFPPADRTRPACPRGEGRRPGPSPAEDESRGGQRPASLAVTQLTFPAAGSQGNVASTLFHPHRTRSEWCRESY